VGTGTCYLFEGTPSDNTRDCVAKGRNNTVRGDNHPTRRHPEILARGDRHGTHTHPERVRKGTGHPHAKLSEDDVRAIRQSPDGYIRTAKRYCVSGSTIRSIRKRHSWKHVA
jgi:hypothetical protein